MSLHMDDEQEARRILEDPLSTLDECSVARVFLECAGRANEVPSDRAKINLRAWWRQHAEQTAAQTIDKMVEYGSGDLVALGQTVRRMANRPPVDTAQAMEIGCLFYLLGKVERAISAVTDDRRASDDTWLDIEVYATMVQAARAGAWLLPETPAAEWTPK